MEGFWLGVVVASAIWFAVIGLFVLCTYLIIRYIERSESV